jgi:hypothetical protein
MSGLWRRSIYRCGRTCKSLISRKFSSALSVWIAATLIIAGFASPAFAANPPSISKAFGAASIPLNGSTSLTFTIMAGAIPLNGTQFTDTLPAGLVVSTPNSLNNTCPGSTATAVAGSNTISLTGASLGSGSSCTVSVNVTGVSPGVQNNSVTVSDTTEGMGNTATASITVVAPPSIIKSFGAASIPINGITTLNFTVTNPGNAATLTGVAFTDTFPTGLVVSTPNGLTGSCGGGSITATAGSNSTSLSGAALAAGASCTFSVNVTGTSVGTKVNSTSNVNSINGGVGNVATASVIVAQATTSITLVSSQNPSSSGQSVTFTATVTGMSPTGTVTFKDGGTVLGTSTLNASGQATLTISTLSVGSHPITATYNGDANNPTVTSAVLTQVVNVPADSIRLRALQLAATKIEAQSSGQMISDSVTGAISDGFSENGASIMPIDNGLRFNFAAEPRAQSGAEDRVGNAFSALGYGPRDNVRKEPLLPVVVPKEWFAWAEVRGTGWNTSVEAGDIRGGQTNALLGLTRKFTPDFLVGMFGGLEVFNYTSQELTGRLKGEGWTVGGYFGWRFLPGLRFDASVARSGIEYDGAAGTALGAFSGTRWLTSAALIGTYRTVHGFEFEPSARVYALWEHEDAYTDSLGTLQTDRNFSSGRASIGTKLGYSWLWSVSAKVTPYIGAYADYYFNRDDANLPPAAIPILLPTQFVHGLSARLTSGVAIALANGPKLSVGGEVGGLSSGNFTVWSLRGRAAFPF